MPQETRPEGPEKPSAAAKEVPPTPLSSSQMRAFLNPLMRTPVGVVQQVGFLLMLFVALVESSLPDSSAPRNASAVLRAAAVTGARHGNVAVADEEKEWAIKFVAFAKRKRARGGHLVQEAGDDKIRFKGVPCNVTVDSLQRWAVRSNRKGPSLLRLLQATPEIGIDDALLVQHHAERISPREAGKVNKEHACTVTRWGGAMSFGKRVVRLYRTNLTLKKKRPRSVRKESTKTK